MRYLHTSAGIVLTASHNPAQYNGYKVYNDNGGQIANEAADEISASIEKTPVFGGAKMMDFDEGLEKGLIEWTPEEVLDAFIEAVKKVSVPGFKAPEGYKVVYTPLNGTGMECVTRILKEIGVNDVTVVPEQANPDGNFQRAVVNGLEVLIYIIPEKDVSTIMTLLDNGELFIVTCSKLSANKDLYSFVAASLQIKK